MIKTNSNTNNANNANNKTNNTNNDELENSLKPTENIHIPVDIDITDNTNNDKFCLQRFQFQVNTHARNNLYFVLNVSTLNTVKLTKIFPQKYLKVTNQKTSSV